MSVRSTEEVKDYTLIQLADSSKVGVSVSVLKGRDIFQKDLGMLKCWANRNQALHSGVWWENVGNRHILKQTAYKGKLDISTTAGKLNRWNRLPGESVLSLGDFQELTGKNTALPALTSEFLLFWARGWTGNILT